MASYGDRITGYFTPNAIARATPSPSDQSEWLVERADEPGTPARVPDADFRKLYEDAAHGAREGLVGPNEAYDAAAYERIGAKDALSGDFADMEFSYRDLRNAVSPLSGTARIVFNRTGATRLDPASCALAEECALPSQDAQGRLVSPSRRRPMRMWMEGEDIPIAATLAPRDLPSPFGGAPRGDGAAARTSTGNTVAEALGRAIRATRRRSARAAAGPRYVAPRDVSRARRDPDDAGAWQVTAYRDRIVVDPAAYEARFDDEEFRSLFQAASAAVSAGLVAPDEPFSVGTYLALAEKGAYTGDIALAEVSPLDVYTPRRPMTPGPDEPAVLLECAQGFVRFDQEGFLGAWRAVKAGAWEMGWDLDGGTGAPDIPDAFEVRVPLSKWAEGTGYGLPEASFLEGAPLQAPEGFEAAPAKAVPEEKEETALDRARAELDALEERYTSLLGSSRYDEAEALADEIEALRQDVADLEDPRAADEAARAAEEAQKPEPARAGEKKRKGKSGPVTVRYVDPATGRPLDGPSPAAVRAREERVHREESWFRKLEREIAGQEERALAADSGTRSFVADCPYESFPGSDVERLLKGEGALAGVALPGLKSFTAARAEDGRTRIVVVAADAAEAKDTAEGMNQIAALAPGVRRELFDGLDGLDEPTIEASLPAPGKTPEQKGKWAAKATRSIDAELEARAPGAWIEYDEIAGRVRLGCRLADADAVREAAAALAERAVPGNRGARPKAREGERANEGRGAEARPRKREGRSKAKARPAREPVRFLDSYLPIESVKGDGPRIAGGLPNPRKGDGDYYIVALPEGAVVGGKDVGGYTFTVPARLVTAGPEGDGTCRLRLSENSTFTARLLGTDRAERVSAPELFAAFAERELAADKPVYGKVASLGCIVGDGGRRGRDGCALPAPKEGKYGPYYDVMLPAEAASAALPGEELPEGSHVFFSVRADDVDSQGLIALKGRDRVSLRLSERAAGGRFQTTRRIAAEAGPFLSAMSAYAEAHPREPEPVRAGSASRSGGSKRRRSDRARTKAPGSARDEALSSPEKPSRSR